MPHIPKLFFKSPNIAYHVVSRTALDGFVLWINKKRVLVCPPLLPDLLGGVLGAIVGFSMSYYRGSYYSRIILYICFCSRRSYICYWINHYLVGRKRRKKK